MNLGEIEEFLILSHLDLVATDGESNAVVSQNVAYLRCERCWRHKPTVGQQVGHPTLCDRCAEVVSELAHQRMKYLIFLGLPLFALDQLTKWLVRQNIPYGAEIPIIPGFFSLVHASNTGAAFSMFTGNNFFFIGLASAALAASCSS